MMPLFTPMRSIADEMLEEARSEIARERAGMSDEQLMRIQRQIEALKERGNKGEDVYERLRELRRDHYEGNGAPGG